MRDGYCMALGTLMTATTMSCVSIDMLHSAHSQENNRTTCAKKCSLLLSLSTQAIRHRKQIARVAVATRRVKHTNAQTHWFAIY